MPTQRMRPRDCGAPLQILFWLLALLMALAAAPTVVFALQGDNEQGNANDPTGAWIVTDTGAGSDGLPSVLATFHKDGTASGDVRGDVTGTGTGTGTGVPDGVFSSPEDGVWKKTGARTFTATFIALWYNRDNSLFGTFEVDANFRLYASGDHYLANFVAYVALPNGQRNNFGSGTSHGERIRLKPPALERSRRCRVTRQPSLSAHNKAPLKFAINVEPSKFTYQKVDGWEQTGG